MLSRYEDEIMSAVFSLCDGTGGCLVSPIEILSILPVKRKYTPEKVDGILYDLMCDGYFDLITSERKGEKMYVINLKENGYAYKRTSKQRQRYSFQNSTCIHRRRRNLCFRFDIKRYIRLKNRPDGRFLFAFFCGVC